MPAQERQSPEEDAARRRGQACSTLGIAEPERAAGPDVLFTGALEHRHLAQLWPLADVSGTPSIFPEAFGMVAAEAAACGSPPLVARHSGLAEIASGLAEEYPPECQRLTSFESGNVDDLRMKRSWILDVPRGEWLKLSQAARCPAMTAAGHLTPIY